MQDPLFLVKRMYDRFGIAYDGAPRHLSVEEKRFRFVCLSEEVMEYLLADDIVDEYDALLDLIVFALGTMVRQGLPLDGLVEVIACNMKKELGPLGKRGGFELDLRKPEGWVEPNLQQFIERARIEHDNS